MMNLKSWFSLAVFFFSFSLAEAGTIRGKVISKQQIPVRDAVVYIEKVPGQFPPPAKPLFINQKNFEFIPHVLPLIAGTTVVFENADTVNHNVFSPSPGNKFDIGSVPPAISRSFVFNGPGQAVLLCRLHTEMSAYVLILQNPYFSLTDEEGNYKILDLPKGQYRLIFWHERTKKPLAKDVNVDGDITQDAALADYMSAPKASAQDIAKEKEAAQNPYANDLGGDTLDVSSYPEEPKQGYKLLKAKCAKCHSAARPLNSQFAEPSGKDMKERTIKVEELKKSNPELFADRGLFQVEADIWQRYVKRMMAKPGCEILKEEGKKIWEFLVYDSNARKLGANQVSWTNHRKTLLEEFKKKYPARHKELYDTP